MRNYSIGYGLLLAILMGACDQPTTFVPNNTDSITNHNEDSYVQANKLLQADYVFVLDYSYSMSNQCPTCSVKLDSLFNSLHTFTQDLKSQSIDYQVGVILGTTHGNYPQYHEKPAIAHNFVSPFLTTSIGDSLETSLVDQMKTAGGSNLPNRRFMLEAAKRTLDEQQSSFVRKSAQLVYMFVSDGDDESQSEALIPGDKSPESYANELVSYKISPDYVSARAALAGQSTGCGVQNDYDEAGTRLAQTVALLDSDSAGADCIYQPFGDTLKDLAFNVNKTTKKFLLRETPLPGSLKVYIAGHQVAQSGNWSFDSANNEIVFVSGKEPDFSQSVDLVYDVAFYLSKAPRPETISVTVDDVDVPQDSANGWTYIASENRIQFNGSAKPSNDQVVKINYQIQ